MHQIRWAKNQMPKTEDKYRLVMDREEIEKVRRFHESFPQYAPTPLVNRSATAQHFGVKNIFVKDESKRFGLNAFKVLGGSYAMARYIADELGRDIDDLPYKVLVSGAVRKELGEVTFITATDGNHGRGVAWSAARLGQNAVVHMPAGTAGSRLFNIQKEGARADITELNYDDCVRLSAKEATETARGVLLQDTAWEGYEKIPLWIMQGYGTMAAEAVEQMQKMGCSRPTHVFVQAGVGSLAGAVVAYMVNRYPENPPVFIVVEADAAACHYQSALAGDGEVRKVTGEMHTIMAGLACGEPNPVSWDILKNHVEVFASISDEIAAKGMQMLYVPVGEDEKVISGESGAAPFGLLATILEDDRYKDLREAVGLDKDSEILLFSTEGDTDPENFRRITGVC